MKIIPEEKLIAQYSEDYLSTNKWAKVFLHRFSMDKIPNLKGFLSYEAYTISATRRPIRVLCIRQILAKFNSNISRKSALLEEALYHT